MNIHFLFLFVYKAYEPAWSTEVHVNIPNTMKPLLSSCDVGALCPLFGVGLINVIASNLSQCLHFLQQIYFTNN